MYAVLYPFPDHQTTSTGSAHKPARRCGTPQSHQAKSDDVQLCEQALRRQWVRVTVKQNCFATSEPAVGPHCNMYFKVPL
jgi:hypothetical protein